jgi:hypothetical protein
MISQSASAIGKISKNFSADQTVRGSIAQIVLNGPEDCRHDAGVPTMSAGMLLNFRPSNDV